MIRKIGFIGIILVFLYVGLNGCFESSLINEPIDNMDNKYEFNFGFNPPNGWNESNQSNDAEIIEYRSPISLRGIAWIKLSKPLFKEGYTLENYINELINKSINKYDYYNLTNKTKRIFNGYQAYEYKANAAYIWETGAWSLKQSSILIQDNYGMFYLFTYSTSHSTFDYYYDDFIDSVHSFESGSNT